LPGEETEEEAFHQQYTKEAAQAKEIRQGESIYVSIKSLDRVGEDVQEAKPDEYAARKTTTIGEHPGVIVMVLPQVQRRQRSQHGGAENKENGSNLEAKDSAVPANRIRGEQFSFHEVDV